MFTLKIDVLPPYAPPAVTGTKVSQYETYALALDAAAKAMDGATPKPWFVLPPGINAREYAGMRVAVYEVKGLLWWKQLAATPSFEAFWYPAQKSWVITWLNGRHVGAVLGTFI